jgi:hypothetical protein
VVRPRGPRLRSKVERFGAIAPQTLSRLGWASEYLEQRAILCWPEAVGPRVAARAQPYRLQRGVLTVRVDGAAWLSELTYLKSEIRNRLNERLGGRPVTELRLVPGTVTLAPPPEPARQVATFSERTLDPAEVAAAAAAVAAVTDPELREALLSFRLKSLRRQPGPA